MPSPGTVVGKARESIEKVNDGLSKVSQIRKIFFLIIFDFLRQGFFIYFHDTASISHWQAQNYGAFYRPSIASGIMAISTQIWSNMLIQLFKNQLSLATAVPPTPPPSHTSSRPLHPQPHPVSSITTNAARPSRSREQPSRVRCGCEGAICM